MGNPDSKEFLFINLSIKCGFNTGINHGLAYLTPMIRKYGYNVRCLNLQKEITDEDLLRLIDDYKPSIVAFSLPSQQLKYLITYSKIIKSRFKVMQIAGGVGPTLDPEGFLLKSSIDGVCRGEGEVPLADLFSALESGKPVFEAKGFYWKQEGIIKKNEIPEFIKDLDSLPFPDYSIYDKKMVCCLGSISVMISRGCPNNCYYCCNDALRSIYPCQGYFRMPSVSHSIRLLEEIVKQYPGVRHLAFEDDLLPARKDWFLEFASEYKKRINLPYRICARAETLNQEVVQALKDSGCDKISIGLENGNELFRKKMLNRNYTNQLFIEKCNLIKSAGIELFTFNIVGFPFETEKELIDTYQLNKKIKASSGLCTFFYPYRDTELYRICERNGLLADEETLQSITNYNSKPAIKMSESQNKLTCRFQRKIYNYLFKQSYFNELKKIPRDRFMLLRVFHSTARYVVYTTPFFYRIYQKHRATPNF